VSIFMRLFVLHNPLPKSVRSACQFPGASQTNHHDRDSRATDARRLDGLVEIGGRIQHRSAYPGRDGRAIRGAPVKIIRESSFAPHSASDSDSCD
jgi:hypothetical protein